MNYFGGTFKTLILDLLEYVTNPNLNTFEDPLIDVIELDINPPVQDSAKPMDNFLFLKYLLFF